MTTLEVFSREAMAEAIRQHAGTDCRIVWGSFSITFRELCEGEKTAVQVLCRKNPNVAPRWEWSSSAPRWEWSSSATARAAPKTARRRVAFEDERDQAATAWDKMPRKTWPRV